jgi:methionyl-tRNA formyltransferase
MSRVLFMGTPDYATTIFEALLKDDFNLVGLFTQPDKPVGRKQILTPPHIKQYCFDKGINIPIYQPQKLRNNEEAVEQIKALKPDFIVVAAYGQILPKVILDIAPCINLHASLLPKYRGASPIQEAILNDDSYLGVTSMLMNEGLDTGDILGFQYIQNEDSLLVEKAFEKLSNVAATLCIQTLKQFHTIKPMVQNSAQSSHCKKIKKSDGEVSFKEAKKVFLQFKAYHFWPGIFTPKGLKLKSIELIENKSLNRAGEILKVEKEALVIGCEKGTIKLKSVQLPSKKAMSVSDFLKGHQHIKAGMNLLEIS